MPVLKLPGNCEWNEAAWPVSGKREIFIRECYPALYGKCQDAWRRGCQLVIVKGTPGVGKSWFLDFAFSRLLQESVPIMVVRGPEDDVVLYTNGYTTTPQNVSLADARFSRLANNVDYVLYDPHEDPLDTQKLSMRFFGGKKVIIAMSPDPANCKKILKDARGQLTLYMGPVSSEEADQMRTSCYGSFISPERLTQRFEQAGGVPRLLFRETYESAGAEDPVLLEISNSQFFALQDFLKDPNRIDRGEVDAAFKGLWSLYHLFPKEGYESYEIKLCCDNAFKRLEIL
jgi:hypothetical protein